MKGSLKTTGKEIPYSPGAVWLFSHVWGNFFFLTVGFNKFRTVRDGRARDGQQTIDIQ